MGHTQARSAWLTSLLFCTFLFTSSAHALSDSEALTEAGQQRMLSQRIAKAWLMLGLQIDPPEATRELDVSMARFEKHFLELQDYAPNKEVGSALKNVEKIWSEFRIHALEEPSIKQAPTIISESERLLVASEALAQAIENYTNIHESKIVNIAARQKMLSQRMAKLYMAEAWGLNNSDIRKKMKLASQEFEDGLKTLSSSELNTPKLKKLLYKVEGQWHFSRTGFNLEKQGRFVPTVISVTSESILKKMTEITGEYAAIMRQQTAEKKS